MKSVEERLCEAYRAAGDTIKPDAIRALSAQDIRARHRNAWLPRRGRALAPLAAAGVTAAVALGASLGLPALTAHHTQSARQQAGSSGAHAKTGPAASLPKFVVENDGGTIQVVDTASWQAVAHVAAPTGQSFESVAGAADDRTFVLAADLNPQTTCATWLYEMHLNSQGEPGPLRQLAPRSAGLPTSVAISADGGTVGYSIVHCAGSAAGHVGASQAIGNIGVLSVASGQSRQWSFSLAEDYTSDLSLSGNGSLIGFSSYQDGVPAASATPVGRLLHADAQPGTVRQRAQILVQPASAVHAGVDSVALSGDGHTLYACSHSGSSVTDMTQTIRAYDTATGNQTQVLRTWHPLDLSCMISADPAGGHLLLATVGGNTTGPAPGRHYVSKRLKTVLPADRPSTVLSWIDLSTGAITTLPVRIPVGTSIGL
ncbi:MAG TPA: hypothetical protein VLM11_15270 [Streptosporangiaceae bacterium]|nr:hypothetical protein [Streptosporangiaceae bacterium]